MKTRDQETIYKAALEYAARNWPIFPAQPNKKPFTAHGYKDATTEAEQIGKWWNYWPGAAIGLDCGGAGLIVIDCDMKNGINGIEAWRNLEIDSSYAFKSVTPSRGLHIIYACPKGITIRNSAGKLAKGIDVRAAGGYILLPPSKVLTGEYRALGKWTNQPEQAPKKLIDLLQEPEKPTKQPAMAPSSPTANAGEHWVTYYLERAYPGCRNEMGFNLAVQLRAEGYSFGDAAGYMANYQRNAPGEGYSLDEAMASLKYAYSKPALEPARPTNARH